LVLVGIICIIQNLVIVLQSIAGPLSYEQKRKILKFNFKKVHHDYYMEMKHLMVPIHEYINNDKIFSND